MICKVLPFLWEELGASIMYRDKEALNILKQMHKSHTDANRATNDTSRKVDHIARTKKKQPNKGGKIFFYFGQHIHDQ